MLTLLLAMSCIGLPTPTARAAIPEVRSPAEPMILRECFAAPAPAWRAPAPSPPPASAPVYPASRSVSSTSGRIQGSVVDDGGLALPGALLTLASPSLIGGAMQRTTDDQGDFAFDQLPPGSYELVAQVQGFGTVKKHGVEVQLGRVTAVAVEMRAGGAAVDVVGERAVVDREQASSTTTMTSDFLQRIPTGRSYQDAVGQAAGVIGGANPNAAGGSYNENTIVLDGVRSGGAPAPTSTVTTEAPPSSTGWGDTVFLSNDDSMSLASAQRLLWAAQNGWGVQPAQVRPHELLNYFSFDTVPVNASDTFSMRGSARQSEDDTLTVSFAVRGASPPHAPLDLTIVLDRSGSMASEGRMEYLKRGLRDMQEGLKPGDRLDVVLFDDEVCTPLQNFVVGRDSPRVLDDLIAALRPRGSTDLDIGLREGYRIATGRSAVAGRNRRVMLITDAELNTGSVNPDVVSEIGEAYEGAGVRLTAIGVGHDFRDDVLDKLSEKGKGAYVYLGSEAVVDRLFGAGFESLTRTVAHDVHFSVDLPPSLAMEKFYGEESSTDPDDIQPIHYYSGTTQLFLQDLTIRGSKLVKTDPVTFLVDYADPETGAARHQSWRTTVGELLMADQHNVTKGRALVAWTDVVLAKALGQEPCKAAFPTWQQRVSEVGADSEVAWLAGITRGLCPAVAERARRPDVSWKLRIDSDQPITGAGLQCGAQTSTDTLGADDTVAQFTAEPGPCDLTLDGVTPLRARVEIPVVGGAGRCLVRGGVMSCN